MPSTLLRIVSLLGLMALAACATPPVRGFSALEAMQRLPPVVGRFARVPFSAAMGAEGDARQIAGTGYRQIAGTAEVAVLVPNAPDPGAAGGPEGPGMAQAMERAILAARLSAAREGGVLTVRHQLNVLREGQQMLKCWVTEVALPARPPAVPATPPPAARRSAAVEAPPPPVAPAPQLRTACVGLVVDRFIDLIGTLPDTPDDMRAVVNLGVQLVRVLRNPASPAVVQLTPFAVPRGGVPGGLPGGPQGALPSIPLPGAAPPDAVPTPPGTRRGRAYSF